MQSRILRLLAALLTLTLLAAACGVDADDTAETPATVLDLAVEAGQFTTLAAAIDAAGLTETLQGEGPFTVLAPTDAAFEAALAALNLTADELLANENLADILTYHVLPQEADSQLVATLDGQSVPTVNGDSVDISVSDGTISVNDAEVVSADLVAENGIVHVINAVLLPADIAAALGAGAEAPADEEMDEPGTIVDVAVAADDFEILVAAVTEAGLAETLSGPGPFTVFAPTDEAFEAAIEALGTTAEELLARDDLADILTYHVVAGEVDAATAISLDGQSADTINGAPIDITVVDGNVVINGTATVVTADVPASNGIIHIIDAVLLPPG
jgi:transforming growth factor-beta-induced protein